MSIAWRTHTNKNAIDSLAYVDKRMQAHQKVPGILLQLFPAGNGGMHVHVSVVCEDVRILVERHSSTGVPRVTFYLFDRESLTWNSVPRPWCDVVVRINGGVRRCSPSCWWGRWTLSLCISQTAVWIDTYNLSFSRTYSVISYYVTCTLQNAFGEILHAISNCHFKEGTSYRSIDTLCQVAPQPRNLPQRSRRSKKERKLKIWRETKSTARCVVHSEHAICQLASQARKEKHGLWTSRPPPRPNEAWVTRLLVRKDRPSERAFETMETHAKLTGKTWRSGTGALGTPPPTKLAQGSGDPLWVLSLESDRMRLVWCHSTHIPCPIEWIINLVRIEENVIVAHQGSMLATVAYTHWDYQTPVQLRLTANSQA